MPIIVFFFLISIVTLAAIIVMEKIFGFIKYPKQRSCNDLFLLGLLDNYFKGFLNFDVLRDANPSGAETWIEISAPMISALQLSLLHGFDLDSF